MAKLVKRRRRRRPRRPHESEASAGGAAAQSGPIKAALRAGRRARVDLADKGGKSLDLAAVITRMKRLQASGRAGAPQSIGQDPDGFMQGEVAKHKDQPAVYYYRLSLAAGRRPVMLALNLTTPETPRLLWLDLQKNVLKPNVFGALSKALKGPPQAKIWPLMPPPDPAKPQE